MQGINFLVYQAKEWWIAKQVALGPTTSSWSVFKDVFFDKYFSKNFLDSQRQEFLTLQQVRKTVS